MNLFIDTSNGYLILILEKENKVIDNIILAKQLRVSDIALEQIDNLLKRNNLSIKEINSIYATKGPGSYTGVRVAITIAKTLKSIDSRYNIYLISSLAYQAGESDCISMLDAKGEKSYLGIYSKKSCVIADQLLPNDYIDDFCSGFPNFIKKQDYQEMDFLNNYISLKDKFELIEDIEKVEPFYIKHFI
ncbi:tRNA threonylcarbamoyladenosine biosynthesis protein TsaB [Spiroplasma helicoides]|uniref:tRNA threonylcarbamoyladenosine biosynthesis protein TsaB n=1 Tax=Spiroplasma helicoides TaxID=216938 RepID=A0A1B3SJM4_9MOLU|nr:tRNA (adenosine(37)-N6)-threonylcarbamoyltransferase complex dimerization subunit type 1 TsaB [Spiroplasma helicoides]AOG60120.1 tRNA threonylcarbamoyladenosine biosynthesis protein TsaB [Spiroplasma helicoides]